MHRLIPVNSVKDIPLRYRKTPVRLLLEYHNLGKPFAAHSRSELLIGMCMDNRKQLRIPNNFAFIIRSGGANLRYSEFKISYAIGVGGVSCIALIGHNQCGMAGVSARKDVFVNGLVRRAGWSRKKAEEHFLNFCMMFEIGEETGFVLSETRRLRLRYPKITVAPLFYKIEDNRLYFLKENSTARAPLLF